MRSFLLIFVSKFVFCIASKSELNELENLFRESKCVEEPKENYFENYLLIHSIDDASVKSRLNYKSEINQLVQFYNLEHSYNVENEEGPPHKRLFNISLTLGDEVYYGWGKTKKEAEQIAAKKALDSTNYKTPAPKSDPDETNSPPTVILNNLAAKHGYEVIYYILDPLASNRIINLKHVKEKSMFTNASFWKEAAHLDAPPKSPFLIEVDVEGQSFYAKSHTIQAAKHDAALKAIKGLKAKMMDEHSLCTTPGLKKECKEAKNKLKSPISLVYEYAQAEKLSVDFKELGMTGPHHKPIFEFECIMGSSRVKAEGKSKKEAKRNAAEKMLDNLPYSNEEITNIKENNAKFRKKNKKTMVEKSSELVKDAINNFANLFSSEEIGDESKDENTDQKPSKKSLRKQNKKSENQWSPKEKLKEFGEMTNLKIQYSSLPKEKSGYFSIVNLDLNPKYICLGIGSNIEISQEKSALNALKFLYKLDLLDDVQEEDLDDEKFSFDNFLWLATEETHPKL